MWLIGLAFPGLERMEDTGWKRLLPARVDAATSDPISVLAPRDSLLFDIYTEWETAAY